MTRRLSWKMCGRRPSSSPISQPDDPWIGEALSRLEKLDAALARQIMAYRQIIGFRNVLVHGYDTIDDQIVWQVIQQDLPVLKREAESLLTQLGPP